MMIEATDVEVVMVGAEQDAWVVVEQAAGAEVRYE